jgi:hypothetical protein
MLSIGIGIVLVIALVLWWTRRTRGEQRAHETVWQPAREVDGQSGLSRFQQLAEKQVSSALAEKNLQLIYRLHRRSAELGDAPYVKASISGTSLEIWIYVDGGSVSGPGVDRRFEDWDARTPEELAERLADTAVAEAMKALTPPNGQL